MNYYHADNSVITQCIMSYFYKLPVSILQCQIIAKTKLFQQVRVTTARLQNTQFTIKNKAKQKPM